MNISDESGTEKVFLRRSGHSARGSNALQTAPLEGCGMEWPAVGAMSRHISYAERKAHASRLCDRGAGGIMASFTKQQIEAALDAKSKHLSEYDLRQISGAKDAVMKMVAEFPESCAKAKRQARLLFEMIEAAANGKLAVHPDELRYAGGALVYLGDSLDIVPDEEADGYADDAAIVSLAVTKSAEQVKKYCASKGLEVAEYLD